MLLLQKGVLCRQTLVTHLIPTGFPIAVSFSDVEKTFRAFSHCLSRREVVGCHSPNQLFIYLSFHISSFYPGLHPLITYHINLVLLQSRETFVFSMEDP